MTTANGKHPADPFGTPTRVIILGYYDGPTAGLVQFGGDRGPAYLFEMPDEDGQLAGDADAREYTLAPLPADALDRFEAAIGRYIEPDRPVWFPIWKFPTPEAARDADAAADAIQAEAGPAAWLMTAPPSWTAGSLRPVRVTPTVPA